jgi:hypothetical protein
MVTVKELNAALAGSLNPIYGALADMKVWITEVETRLTEKFFSRVEGLEDRIKVLEASIKDSEMAILEEIALIDKKRSNVVIFGIPVASCKADKKAVSDLLLGIDAMSDFSCYRAGDADSPNCPIIVRFQSASLRDHVITNAKKLKGQEQYNNISIKPDFTKRQRALNMQKEDALKADAGTRNASMPAREKSKYAWVVTGKPGNRHLAKNKK